MDSPPAPPASGPAEAECAAALRWLARNDGVKRFVMSEPLVFEALRGAAQRFVAGETREDALAEALELSRRGLASTIDYMGEDTWDAAGADAATEEFIRLAGDLAGGGRTSLSLDLSHIGLAVSRRRAAANAERIAAATAAAGTEMMISMEASDRTDAILSIHEDLCTRYSHVGVTLQASLRRTRADVERLLGSPGRIRLVKGAYAEPPAVALPRGPELDAQYRELAATLIRSGRRASIATHDPALLATLQPLFESGSTGEAEVEMLAGVSPLLAEHMRSRGVPVRIYLVYGREWFLDLCHRLAENPANLLRAVADAVGPFSRRFPLASP